MIGWMISGWVHHKSSARKVTHLKIIPALGPLHTRDWGHMSIALQALSLVKEPIQVHFTLRLRDQRSKWVQDGCKVYISSCMASSGSGFMVTWVIFKNHLLEVGLTQNWETMALRKLTTINILFLFLSCMRTPHEYKFIEIAFGWGPGQIYLHTTLEGLWPHYVILGVSWDNLWDTFFWALTISWSRLLSRVWSGP